MLADVDVFRAVADPTRRAILSSLRQGRKSVNQLATAFPLSRPAVSKHLRILRGSRLVQEERNGRFRFYQLNPGPLRNIDKWLDGYRIFWGKSLQRLKHHVEKGSPTERRKK